jgi:hypothetical protein
MRVPGGQLGVRHFVKVTSRRGKCAEMPRDQVLSGPSSVRVLATWRLQSPTLKGARPGGGDGTWQALEPTPRGGAC